MPAKQATRWMAPAAPVFAGAPAPTGTAHSFSWWGPCGSGHAREAGDAVDGTGYAGVRGRAGSYRYGAGFRVPQGPCQFNELCAVPWEVGSVQISG